MCKNRKRAACGGCYPKRATDYTDLFAESVYQFTFRDSYIVSTCVGSVCTIILGLVLAGVLFFKVTDYVDQNPNTFTVTEGLEFGYFPLEQEFDQHLIAVGLSYKAEYQAEMTEGFTDVLDKLVDIEMFTQKKIEGSITTSSPLKLDPCSTLDLNNFYTPRKSSESSMNYLQKYKNMQCLDEFANVDITPSRQQSSQLVSGTSTNDRVKASRGGQDTKIMGDNYNRHDDWIEFLFQVNPCVPDAAKDKTCIDNAAEELAKMELMILFNTEWFNKQNGSTDPIVRDSVVRHFDFNPAKRYEINSVITKSKIDENRGLYDKSEQEFYKMDLGTLEESADPNQKSYIAGKLGLTLDRVHIQRTHFSMWDLVAYAGGLALSSYVCIYIAIYIYQKMERKVYIIKNIFYFAEKLETKVHSQPLNFKVKAELGSRYRITRASLWQVVTCRGYRFFNQIKQGHQKLRMRMDIAKFLEEQKFCKIALSGLLTPSQLMFCEKQSKQIVRHGNIKSTYSDDEEGFYSDDSVMGGYGKHQVGVAIHPNDNYAYVDAMTNRLNETDLRLLRASVNDRPKESQSADNEGGTIPNSYTNEQHMENQQFEKKVKFAAPTRPQQQVRDMNSSGKKSVNVTSNIKSSVVVEDSSQQQMRNSRSKLRDAAEKMNNQSELENLKTIANDEDEYVYRGPKNNTGIFKNSLILKDLTGFVEEPDTNDSRNIKAVNETLDAGTQTMVIEEQPKAEFDEQDTSHLLSYKQPERGTKTYAGTPAVQEMHHINVSQTKRNSIDGLPEAEQDGQQDQRSHHKQVNITNQINKTYIVQGGGNSQKKRSKSRAREEQDEDTGPSAVDLQAQILLELQQANNLAKNTKKEVKKIAKNAKPNNYLSNEELDQLEDHVTNGNNASQANLDYSDAGAARGDLGSAGSRRRAGSNMSARRHLSPAKQHSGANHGNSLGARNGHGAEREPCNRCIENAKKQRANALKKKHEKKGAGQYLSINFDELEQQLKQQDHDCDDFVLNKMHPSDINYRDKRLTKMLGVYQDDVDAAAAVQQSNQPN